jgi:hypothetical protein
MLIWKITPTAATEICDKEDKFEDSAWREKLHMSHYLKVPVHIC